MSEQTLYESERTRTREAIGAYLRRIGDAFDSGGPVPVDEDGSVTADPPAEAEFEVEYEREDDEMSLEFEVEWPADDGATAAGDGAEEASASDDDAGVPEVEETVAAEGSNATFELYQDRADEWRWRLRHHNGNIVADSGEGYSKKANAVNGIESVKANAPGAVVEEQE